MFDLDNLTITFSCSDCHFTNSVTVRQVRLEMRIICRGCKKNLCLADSNATFGRGRKRFHEEIAALSREIKIEIKL
jgi:hypothetical protein